MMKISKQFNELDKNLNEITELDKKVNLNDFIYKDRSPDERFDKYDNDLDLTDKIQNGEIKLSGAKNNQMIFKSHLGEIKKGNNEKRSNEQKNAILKCFTKQETRLLSYLMIILQ